MNESAPQPRAAVGAARGWQTPVPVTDGAWGSSEHSGEWVRLSWALGERGEKKKNDTDATENVCQERRWSKGGRRCCWFGLGMGTGKLGH